MHSNYFVYFLVNDRKNVLYIGVTSNLVKRIEQHWNCDRLTFTRKYNVHRLVYYERHASAYDAIAREKQLKGWRREKKDRLVESVNPGWMDLGYELGGGVT